MISVCMATYNGAKYIEEQLTSILNQIGKNDEVIISDDGSSDNTKEIIGKFQDNRIRFVENQGKHGFTHNFENCLSLAHGDYIFLSDQDDVWMDNKVCSVLTALENYDFVIHDCITVNNDWKTLSESRFAEFNIKPGFWRHLLKSRYLGCCMAFNRRVLETALPFPENGFLIEHDIWLAAVAFAFFKVKQLDAILIYYRRHGGNASSGGFTKGYSPIIKIKKRVYRIVCLMKVLLKKRE